MKNWLWLMALVGACLLVTAGTVTAQPLVTGDLSVYFDFDAPFTDVVPDLSDNGIQAVDAAVEGRVFHSETAIRGGGAAVFDSGGYFLPEVDPETIDPTWYPDDYLDLDGPNVDPALLPGKTFTVSVWVRLTRYGGSTSLGLDSLCDPECAKDSTQGILELRSSDNSYVTHFEARSDGKLRGKIRDQTGEDLVSTQVFTNGDPSSGPEWPDDEWFHYAQTYDANATFEDAGGHWAQYYNGEKIAEGNSEPFMANVPMGDWGVAAHIGRVADENRQLHGLMDEFYIFTRALSPEEMMTLYEVDSGGMLGDVNLDGDVNGLDVDPFVDVLLNGPFQTEADMNEDGEVNGLDVDAFVTAVVGGGTAAVPEPTSALLLLIGAALIGLAVRRRRN